MRTQPVPEVSNVSERSESPIGEYPDQFDGVLELAPIAIAQFDASLKFTKANFQFRTVFQGDHTFRVGELLTEVGWAGLIELAQDAVNGRSGQLVASYDNPEGRFSGWFSIRAQPLHQDTGAQSGGLLYFEDISELKRVEEDQREQYSYLQALFHAARRVGASLDIGQVRTELRDIICSTLRCDSLTLLERNVDGDLIVVYGSSDVALDIPGGGKLELDATGNGIVSWAMESSRSVLVNDPARMPEAAGLYEDRELRQLVEFWYGEPVQVDSVLVTPLYFGSEITGLIAVGAHRRGAFSAESTRFIESIAAYVVIAQRNAELFNKVQTELTERSQAEKLQTALYQISRASNQTRNLVDLFGKVHQAVKPVIALEGFFVALYDRQTDMIEYPYFDDLYDSYPQPRKFGQGMTEWVINHREPMIWTPNSKIPGAERVAQMGTRSACWLGTPLQIDDEVVGVMAIQHYHDSNAYGEPHIRLMEFMATEVARAIELQRREAIVVASESKYRSLIENSNDGIYVLVDNRFELVNRRFLEMLELTQADLDSGAYSMMHFVAPASRELITKRQDLIARGEVLPNWYEFKAMSKNGREFDVEVSVSRVPYNRGFATQGIVRDVSERRDMLEKLLQSQKLEAIGRLAGGVAHEFNNLLTVISGTVEFLQQSDGVSDQTRVELDQIVGASARGRNLTQQLLSFARFRPVRKESVDLNLSIKSAYSLLQRVIGEDVILEMKLAERLATIQTDPTQIELALMNLIINARDAMPTGGRIEVVTSLVIVDPSAPSNPADLMPGKYICLAVTDDGIGMTPDILARAMDPFFTTKPVGKGTGLGLSTIHGLMTQAGGRVVLQSEVGVGTTISLYFPLGQVPESPEAREPIDKADLSGGETVLVADDEQPVRQVAVKALKMNGYKVIEAHDGNDALSKALAYDGKIDLLLTDMMMPGKGGLELAAEIKETRPYLKVMLMSGYSPSIYPKDGPPTLLYPFIAKPFRLLELSKMVRSVLDAEQ